MADDEANGDDSRLSMLSRPYIVLPILFLSAAILISANWNSPFYNYDDADHLQQATENPISDFFRMGSGQTFLPVTWLSMRLDRALFGPPFHETFFRPMDEGGVPLDDAKFKAQRLWAAGSRIENALWHAMAGLLLWLFLRRIGTGPGLAFFTAVAWTAHPMAYESVCWISERKNVLSTLFGFAAMLAWTAPRGTFWRWPLLSVLYLLSAASKPTGVGFFPIFAALEILNPPAGRAECRTVSGAGKIAARLLAPALITAFIVSAGIWMHRVHFVEHAGGSLVNALLTDVEIVARYIFNIALPTGLSFFYGVDAIVSLADPRFWLYGSIILMVMTAFIWISRGAERRLAILGIVWFFAAWGPVSNLAPIPYWMQDRYVYTSSAGLLLAFGCGGWSVLKRLQAEQFTSVFSGAFLTLLLLLSAARSNLFTDSDLLSFEAADRYPNSAFAQVNAYAAARYRLDQVSKIPGPDAAKARDVYMKKAAVYFEGAIRRDDLTQFREAFKFRVDHAELLLESGAFEAAIACLNGFLPPAHLKMRDAAQEFRGAEFREYYAPQTLARAWLVYAQARLSQANPPGVSLNALPLKRRFELCDEAASSLDKSFAVFDWNNQAPYVAAGVELTRVELAKLANSPADVAKFSAAARARLEAIPKTSPYYLNARKLLEMLGGKRTGRSKCNEPIYAARTRFLSVTVTSFPA